MIRWCERPLSIGLVRGLNVSFFVVTSMYCVLTYNAFTYEQFIRPKVSAALASFAVWHGAIHWLVLSMTALTLAPFLERAAHGEIVTAKVIRLAFEQHVGHAVDESTIYRLLARHQWRKVMPRPHHPEADLPAQEAFKKTSVRS